MTPWFPEMSSGGTWDARELSYRRFLQRASYIITGTEVGRAEIRLCYGVDGSRIRLLPHPTPGFALAKIAKQDTGVSKRLGLPENYLLYPAQFWPHKNHVNLLHALSILRDKHGLQIPLVLAGSEKGNVAYVKEVAERLNLSPQVFFTGFVTQAELVDLYRGAAMLVYASLCGPENLPPLEAFALGCPVAAANVPGANEQLGDAAVLFNPIDPADIADKIMKIYSDSGLRAVLKVKGLARAQAWTAHDFALGMLAIFDEFSCYRRCWPQATNR
jgi:glycosyltransferase involved in cell wall biosynthesis